MVELADSLYTCGGIDCVADFYETNHPQSWSVWAESNIRDCDHVIYVCSPLLISDLRSMDQRTIDMSKGNFFSNMVVHSVVAPKFVPVFLNECVPRDLKDWLPTQLHGAKSYKLQSMRDFHKAVFDGPHELRNLEVGRCLGMPKFSELAALVRFLRGERDVLPPPRPEHPIPIPAPAPAERPPVSVYTPIRGHGKVGTFQSSPFFHYVPIYVTARSLP